MTGSDQGATYAAFVEAELAAEYDRRAAVDGRASTVVTTSGAFVALVTAVTVLVTGSPYRFSAAGSRGLLASLASLLVSASLALVASQSRDYCVAGAGTLLRMTNEHWTDSEVTARNVCAHLRSETIGSLRRGSNRKAGLLIIAFVFQMAALVGLVATVAYELRGRTGL